MHLLRDFRIILATLAQQTKPEAALLIPLRLFIGLGWLRAGLEKLLYYDVLGATWLTNFFAVQLDGELVVFPLYVSVIETIFIPYAPVISLLVVAIQLSIGMAIITGTFTQIALIWGILLNLSFVLAGVPDPSAFYLVIQAVLFTANAGAILGADALLSKRMPFILLCAQPYLDLTHSRTDRRTLLGMGTLFAIIGISALPFVRDFSPRSVYDSAMVLMVSSLMMATSFFIAYLRLPKVPDLAKAPNTKAAEQNDSPDLRESVVSVKAFKNQTITKLKIENETC